MADKFDNILNNKQKLHSEGASQIIEEAVNTAIKNTAPVMMSIEHISLNENQPRKFFDEESLDSLKQSIEEYGLIQPLVVYYDRSKSKNAILIAGERRLRACKELGDKFKEIPVFVIEDADKINELALIENVQREDLSAIERADAITELKRNKGYTPIALAKILGKSQDTVRALERVSNLPQDINVSSREIKVSLRELIRLERIEDEKEQQKAFAQLKKKYVKYDELSVPEQRKRQKKELTEKIHKGVNTLKKELTKIQVSEYKALKENLDDLAKTLGMLNDKYKNY